VRGYAGFFAYDLAEDAVNVLEEKRYFYDEVEREVEIKFLPVLTEELAKPSQRRIVINNLQTLLYPEYDQFESQNVASFERKVTSDRNKKADKRRTILRLMFVEDIATHKMRTALGGTRLPKKEAEHHEEETEEE
jgi:hypothetical protein